MPPLSDQDHAELTAYVDGRLDAGEREALEARVASSPEHAAVVARQRRALQLVTDATVLAPLGLRTRVDAVREHATRPRRRSLVIAGTAAALAAAALVVALVLPGGTPGAPTVSEAARLGALAPSGPAPAVDAARPTLLRRGVQGVPFPNWARKFGWRATGVRSDRLHGRPVTTVFYRKGARRLSYSIVGGAGLAQPARARQAVREGTVLRIITESGRRVVTWRRGGHTCVLSSPDAPEPVMLKLAGWHGKGTVPF